MSQSLRKRLPRATNLFFTPTFALAHGGMHTLLGSANLLITTRHEGLRLTLTTLASGFQCNPQAAPRIGEQLLNLLKLQDTLPAGDRAKPDKHSAGRHRRHPEAGGDPEPIGRTEQERTRNCGKNPKQNEDAEGLAAFE